MHICIICPCIYIYTQRFVCLSFSVCPCLSLCLSLCLCLCLSVPLSVCLPACLPACLSVCLSVCVSWEKFVGRYFLTEDGEGPVRPVRMSGFLMDRFEAKLYSEPVQVSPTKKKQHKHKQTRKQHVKTKRKQENKQTSK